MSDPRDVNLLNIPRPDPSALTTVQFESGQAVVRREMLALREYLLSEMNRIEKVHEEKLRGLGTLVSEGKVDQKVALEAALRAAQNLVDAQNRSNAEASDKSERSFSRQIEALDAQTKTITASQSREINDLKERFMGSEGRTHGATDNTARLMAAAMFILALILGFFSISNHSSPAPTVVSPAVVPVQPTGK